MPSKIRVALVLLNRMKSLVGRLGIKPSDPPSKIRVLVVVVVMVMGALLVVVDLLIETVVVVVVVVVVVLAYLHGQIWVRGVCPVGRNRRRQRGRTPFPLPKIHCEIVASAFVLLHAYLSPLFAGINVGAEPISVR